MSDSEADRAGLVPTHAYAMLDIREIKGVRLFMLKNPWSHLRWRGNYSELDTRHWTPEMQKALNYNPKSAKNFDFFCFLFMFFNSNRVASSIYLVEYDNVNHFE